MKQLITILFFFASSFYGSAQTFEIRTNHTSGNEITVDMRCTSASSPTTGTTVLDLVFGIKWLASYNVDLGAVTGNYNIAKSDVEKNSGVYEFQAFYANNTPFAFPEDWPLNSWITILTIPVSQTSHGTGNFEIAESGFDVTTDANLNVDGVDYSPVINGSAVAVPLPIELTFFKVRKQTTNANLSWGTETERNVSHFNILRSFNSRIWQKVGEVKATGNSITLQEYHFTDKDVPSKKGFKEIVYYRLNAIDFDGKEEMTDIKSVSFDKIGSSLTILPNPASNTIQFELQGDFEIKEILFYDSSGRLVLTSIYSKEIDISKLESGIYQIQFISKDSVVATRSFVKH